MVEYRQVPSRYFNLIVYLLAALVNSLPAHTFSSINTSVVSAFGYSKQVVTAQALIFTIFHPIAAFPTNWFLDKYGSRLGCVIGIVFVISGVFLRTLMVKDNAVFLTIGSCLAAFGNLFILNTPMKVAVNWFKPSNVSNVIFLTVLSNLVSMTLGAALPGLILQNDPTQEQIKDFVFLEACVISVPMVLFVIAFRDKPKIPPSKSASIPPKKEKYTTLLRKLFTNKEYMKILFAMTASYGALIAYMANLDQMLNSIGYEDSNEVTAQSILFAMLVGIIGTPIFSIILKKTKKYKVLTLINLGGCYLFFSIMVFIYTQKVDQFWAISLSSGAAGFCLIPMTSLFFAYSAEVAFPIGQASAGGYLFAASQTFGFLLGLIFIAIIDEHNSITSIICLLIMEGLFAASIVFIALTKEDLRRKRYEDNLKDSFVKSNSGVKFAPGTGAKEPFTTENMDDSIIISSREANG